MDDPFSDITLQFFEIVFAETFTDLKTFQERLILVDDHCRMNGLFPIFVQGGKEDFLAEILRLEGNAFFKSRDFIKAMNLYTKSLCRASSKPCMALAYANRSAALFELKLYKECLIDIERALENNYPVKLKPKLLSRQQRATQLKNSVKRHKYYEEIPSIPDSEKHATIQSARNCIALKSNKKYGKHVVATRNIDIGEVLAVEKPYACVLLDEVLNHCDECTELCYNLIPCDGCSYALYCGEICKEKALNSYHKYECPLLETFATWRIGDRLRMALKIALIAKNEYMDNGYSATKDDGSYRSDRFKEIFNLHTNVDGASNRTLLIVTLWAVYAYHFLKDHTEFFTAVDQEDRFKDLMVQLQMICMGNLCTITEFPCGPNSVLCEGDVGCGLYPLFNSMNHSCCPSVYSCCYGGTMVLIAMKTIRKGEQCFTTYGPHYQYMSKDERQKNLVLRSSFNCDCRACCEDWPQRNGLLQLLPLTESPQIARLHRAITTRNVQPSDVEAIKDMLPGLLAKLKRLEMTEPSQEYSWFFSMINSCYEALGSKRQEL